MDTVLNISVGIHVISAALLVGGTFFFRVLLLKYAGRIGGLDDELKNTIGKRWIHVSWNLIFVMIITGFFQMFAVMDEWKTGGGSLPHMIFGMKFLLFLGVLGFMALITKGNPEQRPKFMSVNIWLGVLILTLSAFLARSY